MTGADRSSYVHETCLHGSDDELLGVVVPFLEDGRRGGEATLVDLGERRSELVRAALADPGGTTFLADRLTLTPASRIRQYLHLFESLLADGTPRIRIVGEVPRPAAGGPWEPWARYEAAANEAFAHLPVWGICAYDLRSTTDDMVSDVLSTHPCVATRDGRHLGNRRFEDPARWLAQRPRPPADPLERTTPAVECWDPWPHEARQAVEPLAGGLPPETAADLATAVSEIVSNAHAHGTPPVHLRAWAGEGRVVVTVQDRGTGPADPFAGLLPPARELGAGGLGLWIAHQLCGDLATERTEDGYRVRIVMGAPLSAG